MRKQLEFEIRELAQLVKTNPRRVEGWVEKRFLTPAVRGRGPGRRRVFNWANVLQAALLSELLATFGKRSVVAGRIVRAVARTLRDEDFERLVARAREGPRAGQLAGRTMDEALVSLGGPPEILWIELGLRGGVDIQLLRPGLPGYQNMNDVAARALREERNVVMLNITHLIFKIGERLATLRR